MKEIYITITGYDHYFGYEFMEKGDKLELIKDFDNKFDSEAIKVTMKGLGKIGYVANSPYTVKGESMSAGRIYDKIGNRAEAKIVFIIPGGVICKITDYGINHKVKKNARKKF